MDKKCSPGCICMACSARRRAEWQLGGSEEAFWRAAYMTFWSVVIILGVCALAWGGLYFLLGLQK